MQFRKMGSFEVSAIGLGCNNFGRRLDEAESRAVVHTALECGVTHFDTANTYGYGASESYLGRALGSHRDEVVVVSKFGSLMDDDRRGAAPAYVREMVEASLGRLGTDRIDVCLIHFPDPTTPVADTLGELDALVTEGKICEVGTSNFTADQLTEALDTAEDQGLPRAVVTQDEYSLVHRTPEETLLPTCEQAGTTFVPFFPLGAGVLTGKYELGRPPPEGARLATPGARTPTLLADGRLATADRVRAVSEHFGIDMVTLSIAWLLTRPMVASVITGASSSDQLRHNAAAGDVLAPSEALEMLDRVTRPA